MHAGTHIHTHTPLDFLTVDLHKLMNEEVDNREQKYVKTKVFVKEFERVLDVIASEIHFSYANALTNVSMQQ